jgi:hypothetical protein
MAESSKPQRHQLVESSKSQQPCPQLARFDPWKLLFVEDQYALPTNRRTWKQKQDVAESPQ